VFDAAPLNSSFGDTSSWVTVGNGVAIDPNVPATQNAGAAIFTASGACQFAGLNQTFVMPPFELADPFKITVSHSSSDPSFFDTNGTTVFVGVNGEFKDSIVLPNDVKTESFCLGPRAYGQGPVGSPVLFQLAVNPGPFADSFFCDGSSEATISIDQVKLEIAGPAECPTTGSIVNGDFEAATDWTFDIAQNAVGAIVGGAGENNSRAARLTTVNKCSEVTMTGTAAFPTTIQNPAVDVFFSGTPGARVAFQIAGKNVATLNGINTPAHKRICIPKWAQGTTTSIGFFLQRASDNGCATALAKTFTIDNLTITDDAACASTVELTDPGFENAFTGPVTGWGLTNGLVNDLLGGQAAITTGGAHAGNRALELVGSNECVGVGEAGAGFTVNVPPANGTAGPAIKFFANVNNGNLKTTTRIAIDPGPRGTNPGLKLDIAEVGVYQPQLFCLPPSTIGRRMTFKFSTGDTDGGSCAVNYLDEIALIDDVEVTTDATCPAQ